MKVIHITPKTFDIFYNIGWNNWGRFIVQKEQVQQIAGEPVPNNIKTFLTKRYIK